MLRFLHYVFEMTKTNNPEWQATRDYRVFVYLSYSTFQMFFIFFSIAFWR